MVLPEAAAKLSNVSMIFIIDISWNSGRIWVSSILLGLKFLSFHFNPNDIIFCLTVRAIVPDAYINMYGDKGHPCLTHLWILKYSEACPLSETQLTISVHNVLARFLLEGLLDLTWGKWKKFKILFLRDHSNWSNAFSKSIDICSSKLRCQADLYGCFQAQCQGRLWQLYSRVTWIAWRATRLSFYLSI